MSFWDHSPITNSLFEQDFPFCILNLNLLLMIVLDRKNKRLDPEDQMCSEEFDIYIDFILVLLVFVTSVAALVYKVHGPCSESTKPCAHILCDSRCDSVSSLRFGPSISSC